MPVSGESNEVEDNTQENETFAEEPEFLGDARKLSATGDFDDDSTTLPDIGDKIEVFWRDDNKYYPGKVDSIDADPGKFNIHDFENGTEALNLAEEHWRVTSSNLATMELQSTKSDAIEAYYSRFGFKNFLLFENQGMPGYVIDNAYSQQEAQFLKQVRKVPVSEVLRSANAISSYVLYRVNKEDNGSKKIKSRIAPHGNKDR